MKPYSFLPENFYDLPLAERRRTLDSICDDKKVETINKPLNEEERMELKDTLSKNSVELAIQQEKYDEVKQHWNEEILKPLKEAQKQTISQLRTGTEEMEDEVYYIRDFDRNKVVKFAADGTELESRPMRSDERQSTMGTSIRSISDKG